nr:response regulator [uncultured Holophaga sp.]
MSRILLVEDNEMNRDVLSRLLKRRGYEMCFAEDGEVALRVASEQHPDLILMDISLPVMDGNEATRRLRADPCFATLPIIALTAHALASDREIAMAAGCTDYETKPIDFPHLLEKIARHLDHPIE